MKKIYWRYVWEKFGNIFASLMYGDFAYNLIRDYISTHRPSSLLLFIFSSIIACFLLVRPMPKQVSASPYDWAVAMFGTFLAILMRPSPVSHDFLIMEVTQLLGILISTLALISLNKSFGLVAAQREIKTSGLYRYVRHPVYAGYFISYAAFWAQNMTLYNTLILLSWGMFETMRMFSEEKLLAQDPAYAAYMKTVKWRIIPWLF